MTAISQSEFLQALGWAVLNSLWQMALLWVVYQSVTAIFAIKQSSQKSSLATSLLFAGFAWFVFTFIMILVERPEASGYASFMNVERNSALNRWLEISLPIASIAYLILLSLPLINFIRNYRFVQVIRYYGLSKANVEWRMFVQRLSGQMGITKNVQVWMSEMVNSPVTIGYLKPVILLPVAAVNHLSAQQIEAVLLHELSHIKRFDYLINLITRLIQSVLYFNPFVKAFSRIIEREREKSCDEIVMQFEYEPHGYASALLTLEKASTAPARTLAVAAASGKKSELLGRIESILGIQKKPEFSFNKIAGVMAALLCFIGLNALLIMTRPGNTNTTGPGFLSQISSPFLSFTDNNMAAVGLAGSENNRGSIVNQIKDMPHALAGVTPVQNPFTLAPVKQDNPEPDATPAEPAYPDYAQYVNLFQPVVPQLDEEQEAEIKKALSNSKRVIGEVQWKTLENNIADAMSDEEKVEMKKAYSKALDRADWEKMAENLRIAYNDIDWKALNNDLKTAVAEIRMDSLQHVYTGALAGLANLKDELKEKGLKGIPDSNLTLVEVENKIKEIQQVTNRLKAAKGRKIIHL